MASLNVPYSYYKEAYGGTLIAEEEWVGYANDASAYLAHLDALSSVTPLGDDDERALNMAICAVAEASHTLDAAASGTSGNGPAKSVSIGSVSASFDNTFGGAIDLTPDGQKRFMLDAAKKYLHVYVGLC